MQMQGNDLAMKFMQMWNDRRPELADEVFTSDFRSHNAPMEMQGPEGQKQGMRMFFEAFSDMHFEAPYVSMEGDMLIMRFEGSGRHTGEFMGSPASDKLVCMGGVSMMRVRDGKVSESWDYFDMMGLMQQVGALPSMQMGMGRSEREAA
jgi:steroid delta-isomerase-like uncharacterized protein